MLTKFYLIDTMSRLKTNAWKYFDMIHKYGNYISIVCIYIIEIHIISVRRSQCFNKSVLLCKIVLRILLLIKPSWINAYIFSNQNQTSENNFFVQKKYQFERWIMRENVIWDRSIKVSLKTLVTFFQKILIAIFWFIISQKVEFLHLYAIC